MDKQVKRKDEMLEYAGGDQAFAMWLAEVDRLVIAKWAQGLFDLPDMRTRDAYDAGTTPQDFVDEDVAEMMAEEFGELED